MVILYHLAGGGSSLNGLPMTRGSRRVDWSLDYALMHGERQGGRTDGLWRGGVVEPSGCVVA